MTEQFTDDDYTIRLSYIHPDRIHVERSDGFHSSFENGRSMTFAEVKAEMASAAATWEGSRT